MRRLKIRSKHKEEGFTLIELMVVVLIIAILLAIAIPTFLGARGRAQNRAAESILLNALNAEKTVYTDSQAYSSSATAMATAEPSLSWTSSAPTQGANSVELSTLDSGNAVCVISQAASGNYYAIEDVAQTDSTFAAAGTFYGSNPSTAATVCPTGNTSASAFTGQTGTWGNSTSGGSW